MFASCWCVDLTDKDIPAPVILTNVNIIEQLYCHDGHKTKLNLRTNTNLCPFLGNSDPFIAEMHTAC